MFCSGVRILIHVEGMVLLALSVRDFRQVVAEIGEIEDGDRLVSHFFGGCLLVGVFIDFSVD